MGATWEKSSSWKIKGSADSLTSTFLSSTASFFPCQAQPAAFTFTILSLRQCRLLNSQSTASTNLASQKASKSITGGRFRKRAISIGPWNTKGPKGCHLISSSSKSPPHMRLSVRSASVAITWLHLMPRYLSQMNSIRIIAWLKGRRHTLGSNSLAHQLLLKEHEAFRWRAKPSESLNK